MIGPGSDKNDNDDNNDNEEGTRKSRRRRAERVTAHVKGGEAQRLTRETVTVVSPGILW